MCTVIDPTVGTSRYAFALPRTPYRVLLAFTVPVTSKAGVFDDIDSQVWELIQERPEVRVVLQSVQTTGACVHHERPHFAVRLGSGVNHVKGDWEVHEVVFPKRPFVVFVPARLWTENFVEVLVGFLLELWDLVLLSHDIDPGVEYQGRILDVVVPDVLVVDSVQVAQHDDHGIWVISMELDLLCFALLFLAISSNLGCHFLAWLVVQVVEWCCMVRVRAS